MAGLMSRFTTLFKVKANTMLDKAEDPGQTLDYSYQQQLEMLQKVKRGVADVVTRRSASSSRRRSSRRVSSSSTGRPARRSPQTARTSRAPRSSARR